MGSFLYLRDGTGHASYTYGYLCLNCECLKDRTMSSSVGCTWATRHSVCV